MTRRAILFLCALAAGCGREAEAPSDGPQQPRQQAAQQEVRKADPSDIDADNLLNIAYGASVVSRSGESTFDNSAVHVIDGMSTTKWLSPPSGPEQTMTFSLASPSRITGVGVTTTGGPGAGKVRFEVSADGASWRPLTIVEPKPLNAPQLVSVAPVEARYLRVTTADVKDDASQFLSVHAMGAPVGPPRPRSVTGCWMINHARAHLVQNGARITGVIESDPPTLLDGGSDGFVARMMWKRGPTWGNAAMTFAPNDRTVSALLFYEEPLTGNVGEGWLGERCEASEALPPIPDTPAAFLERTGHWTLSGLLFDEGNQLVEPLSRETLDTVASIVAKSPAVRFRLVAHEFRDLDPARNKARSAARLDSLHSALAARGVDFARVQLVASGSDAPRKETSFAVQRLLNSRIDLERVP